MSCISKILGFRLEGVSPELTFVFLTLVLSASLKEFHAVRDRGDIYLYVGRRECKVRRQSQYEQLRLSLCACRYQVPIRQIISGIWTLWGNRITARFI